MAEKKKRISYSHSLKKLGVIPRGKKFNVEDIAKALKVNDKDKEEMKRLRSSLAQGRKQGWVTRPESIRGTYILLQK